MISYIMVYKKTLTDLEGMFRILRYFGVYSEYKKNNLGDFQG